MIPSPVLFKDCLDFNNFFFWSALKDCFQEIFLLVPQNSKIKACPVRRICKLFTNARIPTRAYELRMQVYKQAHMNLRIWDAKMRGEKLTHMNLRIWGCQDARIQASTHKPEDMRMQRCEDISKHTWTWGYEDVRMQGYKQAHIKLRIWGCKDARTEAHTYEPEDMRM